MQLMEDIDLLQRTACSFKSAACCVMSVCCHPDVVPHLGWQVENVECMPDDHIKFDFLGKDSIRYENEVVVHHKVYKLIQKFCRQFDNKKGELLCNVELFPWCSSTISVRLV